MSFAETAMAHNRLVSSKLTPTLAPEIFRSGLQASRCNKAYVPGYRFGIRN